VSWLVEYLPIVAFVVSYLVIKVLMKSRLSRIFLDIPNHRSGHEYPVPCIGGLAIWMAVTFSVVLLNVNGATYDQIIRVAFAGTLVAGISLLDDYRHTPVLIRLLVHFLAAAMLLIGDFILNEIRLPGYHIMLSEIIGAVFTLFFIVWMINLYNFMDGMDGLAAGMSVIGFFTLSVLGVLSGEEEFTRFTMIVMAVAGGFLIFNFPPAKIFMGDSGSTFLGFLGAGTMIWGQQAEIFPLWIGILIFSPFIVDATVTLAKRVWYREKVWKAHRNNYFHRLVDWWGVPKILIAEYLLMIACSMSAIFAIVSSIQIQWTIIGLWVCLYLIAIVMIDSKDRKKESMNSVGQRDFATVQDYLEEDKG